jgi:hypothetical protein
LPFLNIGTTAAFFQSLGKLPVSKLRLEMWCKRWVNISEQPFIIKLGISSRPTRFVERRRLIARVTSVTEICGIFRTSDQVKSEIFVELKQELTQKEAIEVERKWSAKSSAINCGSVIILSPTSIWVTNYSFLLNLETYFQKCFGWVLKLSSIVFSQAKLSILIVVLTSLR